MIKVTFLGPEYTTYALVYKKKEYSFSYKSSLIVPSEVAIILSRKVDNKGKKLFSVPRIDQVDVKNISISSVPQQGRFLWA